MESPGDSCDAIHQELGQISQVKGTVLHENAFTADPSCMFGGSQASFTSGVPLTPQVH